MLPMLFALSVLAQDDAEEEKAFAKILPGHSEKNVRELVGNPERVEGFVTIRPSTKDTNTYWVYPNTYTIIFKNHFVDYVEKNRVEFLKKIQSIADPSNPQGIRIIYGNKH
jgi:hypothetical protein